MAGKPKTRTVLLTMGGVAAAGGLAADPAQAMLPSDGGGGPTTAAKPDTAPKGGHPAQQPQETPAPRKATPPPIANDLAKPRPAAVPIVPAPARQPVRPDPGTSTNSDPVRRAPARAAAPGRPPVRVNPAQNKPKVMPVSTDRATPPPVSDPGTSTNNDPVRQAPARTDAPGRSPAPINPARNKPKVMPVSTDRATPPPVSDPGTGTNNDPVRQAPARTDAPGRPPAPINPARNKPKVDPGTTTNTDPATTGPTPQQLENARQYAATLDQIDAQGGALNMGTATRLRRYGGDPKVTEIASRMRKTAAHRKKVYDDGGVVEDTTTNTPRLQRNDDDPSKVNDFTRTHTPVTVDQVVNDGNRKTGGVHEGHGGFLGLFGGGDPTDDVDVKKGYTWNDGDDDVPYWYPQGIDGQGNRQVVSWYSKEDDSGPEHRGRVSFVDTDKGTYRHALLVDPKAGGDYDPVKTHAGGVVWQGDHMYVADTNGGLKVFDTSKMVRSGDEKQSGKYKYLLPKVGSYDNVGGDMKFSSLSMDRSDPDHPALVVTEYRNDHDKDKTNDGDTHVARWDVGPDGQLTSELPSAKYVTKRQQMQGGAMDHGKLFLSSSAPSGDGGALYSGTPGHGLAKHPWGSSPESLYVQNGLLWSLAESPGHRAVYGSSLADN